MIYNKINGLATTPKNGDVVCWKPDSDWNSPTKNSTISSATQIVAGHDFFCVRVKDLSVKCWGNNDYGQLMKPPFGVPSCVIQDSYGVTSPGCASDTGKTAGASLVCDAYGAIDCKKGWPTSDPNYKISCPTPSTANDQPKCVKLDFGVPLCLLDSYGYATPKCSKDIGKTLCDPYGKISCGSKATFSLSSYQPVCNSVIGVSPVCTKSPPPKDPYSPPEDPYTPPKDPYGVQKTGSKKPNPKTGSFCKWHSDCQDDNPSNGVDICPNVTCGITPPSAADLAGWTCTD